MSQRVRNNYSTETKGKEQKKKTKKSQQITVKKIESKEKKRCDNYNNTTSEHQNKRN